MGEAGGLEQLCPEIKRNGGVGKRAERVGEERPPPLHVFQPRTRRAFPDPLLPGPGARATLGQISYLSRLNTIFWARPETSPSCKQSVNKPSEHTPLLGWELLVPPLASPLHTHPNDAALFSLWEMLHGFGFLFDYIYSTHKTLPLLKLWLFLCSHKFCLFLFISF